MTGPGAGAPPLICQVCGTENPATRQFCRRCASDLRAPVPTPGVVPTAPIPEPSPVRPIILGGGLALLAVVVLAGTFLFLTSGGPGPTPGASPTAAPSATAQPSLAASEGPTDPPVTAEPTAEPTEEPSPEGTVRPPRIRSFVAPDEVPCDDPSYDGFILVSWEIRNATGATISIDGPGIYEEYEGLKGRRVELPFACSGPHTYLLTTVGGVGPPATKELTVNPLYPASPSPELVAP